MNQKDYKAIAEIMKSSGYMIVYKKGVVQKLADYFEKEEFWQVGPAYNKFNKQQFLKDCGVKE